MSTAVAETPATPMKRIMAMRGSLLLNVAAPFVIYEIMTRSGSSELTALAIGSLFPALGIGVAAVRNRRLDWIGVITLAAMVVGLAGALVFASPRFLLIKDSMTTATVGLTFLASLAMPRPLIFVLARQMNSADPRARAALDQRWSLPRARRRIRRLTAIWGLALLGEAALRAVLSFLVAPATLILVSPLLAAAVFGGMATWSIRDYRAHARA
jgi:hypothetical protein